MNLIKRTTLHYQNNPESIYEVNLWEVGEGKYKVDFTCVEFKEFNQYSTQGTKTKQPVSLEEAEKIFHRFIRDKKKRGYVNVFQTSDDSISITQPFFDDVERKQVILERLENNKPSKWKLERAIWRAGELKIKEATPLLINFIGTGEALRDYCIVWSLGWCGDESAINPKGMRSAIAILTELYENPETPEFVSRIAFEALLKLVDEGTKATLQAELIASLPLELGRLARTSSQELFEQFAVNHPYYFFEVFEKLYQVDNPYIRPSILKILRTVPFQPNYFRSIRRIFKIAEYRRDAEVFGILAYRFERVGGNFNNDLLTFSWDEEEEKKYRLDNKRVYDDELKKSQPIVAYSYQTQQYLRRRVWRTLKILGEMGDANYIKMAVAVLLEYSDNDEPVVVRSQFSQWDNFTRDIKQYWDRYADYLTFNHILYSNSPRYFFNSKKWFRRRGCDVDAEITVREEAFPRLWEQYPQALLKLLLESQCLAVHRFAVKVLRDCGDFCTEIDINTVIQIVYSDFAVTAAFGFELALQQFDLGRGNQELLESLENRLFKPLPNSDYFWVQEEHRLFLDTINLINSLIISPDINTYQLIRRFLNSYVFSHETNKILTERFITQLLVLSERETETAQNIIEILIEKFTHQLKLLEFDVILDLLGHSIIEVQEFGALIVINYYNRNITSKFSSVYHLVSLISIERIGDFNKNKTSQKTIELISFLIQNSNLKISNAVKTVIRRLIQNYPSFKQQLISHFIEILLTSIKTENFHKNIIYLLQEDLEDWEISTSKEVTFQLISAHSLAARVIGSILLQKKYYKWINEFTTSEIILLANHDNFKLRETAHKIIRQIVYIDTNQEIIDTINSSKYTHKFIFNLFTKDFYLDKFLINIFVTIYNYQNNDNEILGTAILNDYISDLENDNLTLVTERIYQLLNILINKQKHENDSVTCLDNSFSEFLYLLHIKLYNWMKNISHEYIFYILNYDYYIVQQLGNTLLKIKEQDCIDEFKVSHIIALANHKNSSTRTRVRQIFIEQFSNIRINRQDLLVTVQLLDSRWKDTYSFAYNLFNKKLNIEEFKPEIIVKIFENKNKQARQLGKKLLNNYFDYVKLQHNENYDLQVEFIYELINILLKPEKIKGNYHFIVNLLKENLELSKKIIDKETTLKLINTQFSLVQELGNIIFTENSDDFTQQLTIREIVKLADHDILSIRQAAKKLFSQNLNRFRNSSQEMLEAVRILDAKWEDTREFAHNIFTTEFNQQDFTSDVLIAICDSTNVEARKIGRDLLTRNFQEVDGEEYFLKLSEHPAQDIQKFVTNYFEKYATDNPQRLRELTSYFITVLSSVNRNRTAKKRVLNFLKSESDKSREIAEIIAQIISRQSLSMTNVDKLIAIEIMLKIKKKYPDIDLPIQLQPVTEERRKSLKAAI